VIAANRRPAHASIVPPRTGSQHRRNGRRSQLRPALPTRSAARSWVQPGRSSGRFAARSPRSSPVA
jgi:hypothetical protein